MRRILCGEALITAHPQDPGMIMGMALDMARGIEMIGALGKMNSWCDDCGVHVSQTHKYWCRMDNVDRDNYPAMPEIDGRITKLEQNKKDLVKRVTILEQQLSSLSKSTDQKESEPQEPQP